jgi:AcrR family transcriptional regulator
MCESTGVDFVVAHGQQQAPPPAITLAGEGTKQPASAKGRRTRRRIVESARVVFEEKGYLGARVVDIASGAGVGHGTFYTYFDSKEEIFAECAAEVADDLFTSYDFPPGLTQVERLHETNRRYIERYERNAAMMALIEQVALFDSSLRELRLRIRRHFADRVEGAIARMNRTRFAGEPQLDPYIAANALGGMVDNFCYAWFVLGEPFDRDLALETLGRIWERALMFPDSGGEARVSGVAVSHPNQ